MTALRLYTPEECGHDGYPPAWHNLPLPFEMKDLCGSGPVVKGHLAPGIKHLVRDAAGHRCVRCLHPYRNGEHGNGEWSPCDEQCTHSAPYRAMWTSERMRTGWQHDTALITGPVGPFIARSIPRMALVVEAHWRILTVHHLDGVKANCRWWNLAALCQRCHLQIQGKVRMERVWPWEHSDWFKPYVAGYYAWTYLRLVLTREETEERLEELLGLERQA